MLPSIVKDLKENQAREGEEEEEEDNHHQQMHQMDNQKDVGYLTSHPEPQLGVEEIERVSVELIKDCEGNMREGGLRVYLVAPKDIHLVPGRCYATAHVGPGGRVAH